MSHLLDINLILRSFFFPDYSNIPCKVAGWVPRGETEGELNLDRYVSKSDQRSLSLASCYAVVAAQEAMEQSGLQLETEEQRVRAGQYATPNC